MNDDRDYADYLARLEAHAEAQRDGDHDHEVDW